MKVDQNVNDYEMIILVFFFLLDAMTHACTRMIPSIYKWTKIQQDFSLI